MEKPEVMGLNAVACILDQVAATAIIGSAGIMVAEIALACNAIAVAGVLGVG